MKQSYGKAQMLTRKATELANFLIGNKRTAEDIAKFLVLKTFASYSPSALYIAELSDDGHLAPVGGFGFEKTAIARLGRVPLSLHIPITDVVRRDECIFVHNVEQLYSEYPSLEKIEGFVTEWKLAMAWPILPFGVGFAFLDHPVDLNEDFENYLRLTGAVIALHLLNGKSESPIPEYQRSVDKKRTSIDMTNRQKVILEMLSKGATNSEIALEIGYSESLVRQETIEIYRVLGVSGRRELIALAGNK
jgi:hypothetical protein